MKEEILFDQKIYLFNNYKIISCERLSKEMKINIIILSEQIALFDKYYNIINNLTVEQIELLKNNYNILSKRKLSILLNVKLNIIQKLLIAFNLININKRKSWKNFRKDSWTDEQIEYLKINFDKLNMEYLSKALNKSAICIWRKAKKLQLSRGKKILKSSFTIYEDEILKENIENCNFEELKLLLPNKTEKQIIRRINKLKIRPRKQTIPEKIMESILYKYGIAFKKEESVSESKFINDFIIDKYIIEVQGDYWHGNPYIYSEYNSIQLSMIKRDIRKKEELESLGYKVIYFWEYDLKNKIKECEERLLNILRQQ